MSKMKYFKLGPLATSFADPKSGMNIAGKEVVEVDASKVRDSVAVDNGLRGGHIVEATADDFHESERKKEKGVSLQSTGGSTSEKLEKEIKDEEKALEDKRAQLKEAKKNDAERQKTDKAKEEVEVKENKDKTKETKKQKRLRLKKEAEKEADKEEIKKKGGLKGNVKLK